MRIRSRHLVPLLALVAGAAGLQAQAVPTTQPNRLTIFIESLKPGTEPAHTRNEAGWPAALAAVNSPYYYLALESMTGPSEVWYVSSYESYAQEGENLKMYDDHPALAEETARLWTADAPYLSAARQVQAVGRPDLSIGPFADIARHRFWEISVFRVRIGHEAAFEAALQAFTAAAERLNTGQSFRTYQVVAGMNGSNYMFFTSMEALGYLDQMMEEGSAMFQQLTDDERNTIMASMSNDVQNTLNNRYRLSPSMSYVDAETKAADPDFWGITNR